jgi:hypothetical protein
VVLRHQPRIGEKSRCWWMSGAGSGGAAPPAAGPS